MSAILQSGATLDVATVGPTSKALHTQLYDAAGNVLGQGDKTPSGLVPGASRGLPSLLSEGKSPRFGRVNSDGSLSDSLPVVQFFEPVEGATYNSNLWLQTLTTFTVTQANGLMTFNAGNSVTSAQGALHTSTKFMALPMRSKLIFRSRQRHTPHYTNNVMEFGLATPVTNATSTLVSNVTNGAFWTKDGSGQYVPRLMFTGGEVLGTPISNSAFTSQVAFTDFATFEVEMDQEGAWFRIYTASGVLVTGSEQRLGLGATVGAYGATHFQAFLRCLNTGIVATAVQMIVGATAVYSLDTVLNKNGQHLAAGLGFNCLVAPLTFGQTPNFSNQVAPTTRTVSNISVLEATLGGHVSWNNSGTSFGASDTTDLILFGFSVPLGYNLFLNGLRLSTVNLGVANGANPYVIEYWAANHSSGNLASGTPRFIPLGTQRLAPAAAVGEVFDKDTVWNPATPLMVLSGRSLLIGARVLSGSATAAQVIRTLAAVDGWFE